MNRQREIKLLKTTKENQYVVITLRYDIGGMNFFTYQNEPRGYYLSVCPEERADGWRKFGAFTGIKHLLKPAARFSQKELDTLEVPQEQIDKLLTHVLAKNTLTIAA